MPRRRPSGAPAGASFAGTLLPCPGRHFLVSARAVASAIFTAASKAIAVEEASGFHLTLGIGQRLRGICTKRTVAALKARGGSADGLLSKGRVLDPNGFHQRLQLRVAEE